MSSVFKTIEHMQARETDHPVKFTPPEWANVYEKDEDFAKIPNIEVKFINTWGADHISLFACDFS